jgi:uncharacterized repeat protein (TIGR03803 family)
VGTDFLHHAKTNAQDLGGVDMGASSTVVQAAISGTLSGQTTTDEAPFTPFATAVLATANPQSTDTLNIVLTGGGGTLQDGAGYAGLVANADGSYALNGTAAQITSELQALIFTPAAGAPGTQTTTIFQMFDTTNVFTNTGTSIKPATLATFNGTDGAQPKGYLLSDRAGDLFGTTYGNNTVTIFEVVRAGSSYNAPVTLFSVNAANGVTIAPALVADAAGDLFGTTNTKSNTSVFELVKSGTGFAPVTLASFTETNNTGPVDGVMLDAAGDVFGTTYGNSNNNGTVFELVKTASGYGAPVTLASFNGTNGADPFSLMADAAGDVFGFTATGGSANFGTVFELPDTGVAKTGTGYGSLVTLANANNLGGVALSFLTFDAAGDLFGIADGGNQAYGHVFEVAKTGGTYGAPVVLYNFTGATSQAPLDLIADSAGDLFGTTSPQGFAATAGTVFELLNTGSGYQFVTLASIAGITGNLIADAAGNLFCTTSNGGTNGDGSVIELLKAGSVYSTPVTLINFTGANGSAPVGALMFDAAGDLFGTASSGGASGDGTVFELTRAQIVAATTTVSVADIDLPIFHATTGGTTITFTSGPGNIAYLSGTGGNWDTVNGSGGTVDLTSAQATINGNTDAIALAGAGNSVTINGTGDTVAAAGNGQNGAADYITFASGGVVTEAASASINAYGSGVTVNAGGSDNLGLYGANDTANISGTGSQVWAGGNGQNGASDYVNFAQGGVLNEASGANLNVFGSGVTVNANGSDNLGLYGSNDTATISGTGSQVWAGGNGQNGASDYVNFAQGGVLNEASGANLNAFGNGVTVNANGADNLGLYGANDTATISGTGSQVWAGANGQNGASDYITFAHGGVLNEAAGASLNAFGSGVTVNAKGSDNLGLYGANDTATIGGTGSQVWAGGNGQNGASDYITFANGGVLNEAAGANLNVFGSGVTVAANGADNLGLYGASDSVTISGTGSQVWTGGNGQNGAADYFHFASGGVVNEAAGASINVYGNSITANASGSDNLGIYGTGDTVKLGGNDGIWAGAGSDVFAFAGTTGYDTITGFVATGSNHDTLQFSSSVFADWAHLLGATKQQGSDLLITIDASDTVVLKNVTLASFTSADAKFV